MRVEFKYLATRSGKSLILSVDNKKYLFNVFEGFQRYCIEARVRLNKISSIFLPSAESIPPLVATYLTLRDIGRESLEIICDTSLRRIIDSANNFASRDGMEIKYAEEYVDNFVKVESIRNGTVVAGKEVLETSYILNLSPMRGKLLVDEIPRELPKNLYSKLSMRRMVEYNGRVYNGNEYVENDVVIGPIGIIYSSGNYEELWMKIKDMKLKYVFCFQRKIAEYLRPVMQGEFFVLEDSVFVEYGSLYDIQLKLSSIYEGFLVPLPLPGVVMSLPECLQSCDVLVYDRSLGRFDLTAAEHRRYEPGTRESKAGSILFLGTGCAVPSKYRNVSAMLYESVDNAIMLDCGEDSLFQIHRAYGNFDVLKKLSAIFISHSHADHVLGVVSVLKKTENRIRLFGPSCIKPFIEHFELGNYEFSETDYAKVLERKYAADAGGNVEQYLLRFNCGFDISICGVEHCPDSCGIKIRDGGITLSYSGDSRPSILFRKMSCKADVIVHEATFCSSEHERAIQRRHSTVGEAVTLFRESESDCLLLTHFSQRYSKGVISDGNWIPCMDLFRHVIGNTEYPTDRVNEYYRTLDEEQLM